MDKGGQEINWRTWLEDGGKWTLYAKHFCDFFTKLKQWPFILGLERKAYFMLMITIVQIQLCDSW